MATMRAKNSGTFDHTTNTWRLRAKNIQISIRQLGKRYGVEIGRSEKESAPYWRRYLQDLEDGHRAAQKATSPLQDRIRSAELMLERLKAEGRPESDLRVLEGQLRAALDVPVHDIDHADIPVLHPAVEPVARLSGVEINPLTVGLFNSLIPLPSKPTRDTIKHEATVFIHRHKAKGHKGWYQVRQAIDMLLEHTGDITLPDVSVHHWRKFFDAVKTHPSWGDTTRSNVLQVARTFLERVEIDHKTNYSFIRNPDYFIRRPKGRKEQYTPEQVQTALRHATGDVRYAVLIGLNVGAYWGDITTMTPDMIQGDHMVRVRDKLRHNPDAVVGRWYLWPQTRERITYGLRQWKLEEQYTAFRRTHGLPEHKALRKTTAQLIQDKVGEGAARLFRGEGGGDTHHNSYIKSFTPDQVETLGKALRVVGTMYGLV